MAKDQSNPSTQLITLEMARAAGQAHGETAFTAMVSPETFEEFLKAAMAAWRSAGFSCACLDEAGAAARAAYRGSSAGCRAGEARRRQLEPDTRTVVERLGIGNFPPEDWELGPWGQLPIAILALRA
jgi:hypothetical protein